MPVFEPPTDDDVSLTSHRDEMADNLFRFYKPLKRGRNVWILNNGTVTENDPSAGEFQTVYYGGHIYNITQAEADVLTAAGYGANITP
jgi:hypothetical protein